MTRHGLRNGVMAVVATAALAAGGSAIASAASSGTTPSTPTTPPSGSHAPGGGNHSSKNCPNMGGDTSSYAAPGSTTAE
jgi:hypothetical protein